MSSAAEAPTTGGDVCPHCGKEMPPTAKVCSECGFYRRRWRNELKFWSGVLGIGTVAVAAILFSADITTSLSRLLKPDLAVSEVDSQALSVIWNQSGRLLWVDALSASRAELSDNYTWQIHRTIKSPEEPLSVELSNIVACRWIGDDQILMDAKGLDGLAYLPKPGDTLPPDPSKVLTEEKFALWQQNKPDLRQSYAPVVLYAQGEHRSRLDPDRSWASLDYTCKISYRRLDEGTSHVFEFPCVAILAHHDFNSPKAECRKED